MKYVFFKNDVTLLGYYEEPIDDGHPEMGSYTKDITRKLKNEVAEYNEERKAIVIINEYGVSMFGSTAYLYINVDDLLKTGDIALVDREFCCGWCDLQEAIRENKENQYRVEEAIYFTEGIQKEQCERLSEELLRTALLDVRLKSEMIQMSLTV